MILKKPLFPFLFIVILVIGILQTIATQFYLYWLFSWFDILMHFLGGFWFGFVAVWFVYFSGYTKTPRFVSRSSVIIVALVSALGVGLAWEVFEYFTGLTFTVDKYIADTILDIIMDTIGGLVAALFLYRQTQQNNDIA